uniref:Phosphoprotein n=1 Tax=Respirovirus suis TaxID=3052733 RepID=A0A7T4WNY1_9MONO|nr:phosphoprotein [Respirovirus suis]
MDQDAFLFEEPLEDQKKEHSTTSTLTSAVGLIDIILASEPTDIRKDRKYLCEPITAWGRSETSKASKGTVREGNSRTEREDHGQSEESGTSRESNKFETEVPFRETHSSDTSWRAWRRSSTDSVLENMGDESDSYGKEINGNGGGNQRQSPEVKVREVDPSSNPRRKDKIEGLPEEIRGGSPVPDDREGRRNNNGGGLELVSTHNPRVENNIIDPTHYLEEEVLKRNKPRGMNAMNQWSGGCKTGQQDCQHESTTNPTSPNQNRSQGTKKGKGKELAVKPKTRKSKMSSEDTRNTGNIYEGLQESIREKKTDNESSQQIGKKGTEESTLYTEEVIKLLVSLGVIPSVAAFNQSRNICHVFAKRVLNSVNSAEMNANMCGLLLSVEKSVSDRIEENKMLINQVLSDLTTGREVQKRFTEYQKEQNSLIMSNLATLHIITDRGGKNNNLDSGERKLSIKTKGKEPIQKTQRFDPSMEFTEEIKYKPDLYREDALRQRITNPVLDESTDRVDNSNAARLIPCREKSTLRSLKLIIESSNLSKADKIAYIRSLSKCKDDKEVESVMKLFEEDIESSNE